MLPELPRLYWILVILRVLLVFIPQVGYIHPDEFFQSIEVFAGKIFGVVHRAPWEFDPVSPIRSTAIPYFTTGVAYKFLSLVNFLKGRRNWSVIAPYTVVVMPRLISCLLSFLVDLSLYKICRNNNEPCKSRMIILASSYVSIVYATRTFNNSYELVLFSVLLYYVSETLIFSNILMKKREYLNYRYEQSKSIVERVKFHKLRLFLTSDTFRNCFQISTLCVFGCFNRPTFLGFGLFPVFFWLYRGLGHKLISPTNFFWRTLAITFCAIPSLLLNVLMDSFFYGYLTWGEIGMLDVSINNFIFVPWNFIKYNVKAENLAQHGLHPRFLHILVNMPLLFGLLAVFAVFGNIEAANNFVQGRHQLLPRVRSLKSLMNLSYLAPLLLLSIFPHQEPRFLIPLILPLTYLYGGKILPESESLLVKRETTIILSGSGKRKMKKSGEDSVEYNFLFKLWLTVNGILVVFFGFIHQGGIYPAASFITTDIKTRSVNEIYHIFTSHIYSMPESLFLQRNSGKLHNSVDKRFYINEQGSEDLPAVLQKIKALAHDKRYSKKQKILFIAPSSLQDELDRAVEDCHNCGLKFVNLAIFYPHLSTETFPRIDLHFAHLCENIHSSNITESITNFGKSVILSFGLKLYEVRHH